MIYLNTFLYYTFFASAILFYGLGINQIAELNFLKQKSVNYAIKIIISIMISVVLSWIVTQMILVPLKIVEIFPIVCFLIYICITTFLEALIRITTSKSSSEFLLSYMIIILSVSESHSILNTLVISGSCITALGIMFPLTYVFRRRYLKECSVREHYFPRYLLYITVILLIISVWDVMWLNPEVIK